MKKLSGQPTKRVRVKTKSLNIGYQTQVWVIDMVLSQEQEVENEKQEPEVMTHKPLTPNQQARQEPQHLRKAGGLDCHT